MYFEIQVNGVGEKVLTLARSRGSYVRGYGNHAANLIIFLGKKQPY